MRRFCMGCLGFAALAACQGSEDKAAGENESRATLPPIKVNLPPAPSFDRPRTPEKYPDDTLSVYGLRKKLDQHLDQDLRVKGVLLEYYTCPCPGGKTTDKCTCELPHFWIADEPATPKDKALLVADMPYNDLGKRLDLKVVVGQQYIVQGTFARQSNTGFAASDGLIIYKAHGPADGSAPVAPPNPSTR